MVNYNKYKCIKSCGVYCAIVLQMSDLDITFNRLKWQNWLRHIARARWNVYLADAPLLRPYYLNCLQIGWQLGWQGLFRGWQVPPLANPCNRHWFCWIFLFYVIFYSTLTIRRNVGDEQCWRHRTATEVGKQEHGVGINRVVRWPGCRAGWFTGQ